MISNLPTGGYGFGFDPGGPDPLFGGDSYLGGFNTYPDLPDGVQYGGRVPNYNPILGGTPPFINGPNPGGSNAGIYIPGLGNISLPGISFPSSGSGGTKAPNTSGIPPWLLPILAGLAGGLNNRPGTTTTVPTFDSGIAPLRQSAIDSYTGLLSKDPNLTGYQADQTSQINKQSDIARQNAIETAAARGISGPAVDTALNSIESKRGGDIVNLGEQIPLLKNKLTLDNTNAASAFILGNKGQSITSPGNIAGGAVSGAAGLLAYLYGLG